VSCRTRPPIGQRTTPARRHRLDLLDWVVEGCSPSCPAAGRTAAGPPTTRTPPAQPALHRHHPGQEARRAGGLAARPRGRRAQQGRRPPSHRARPPPARGRWVLGPRWEGRWPLPPTASPPSVDFDHPSPNLTEASRKDMDPAQGLAERAGYLIEVAGRPRPCTTPSRGGSRSASTRSGSTPTQAASCLTIRRAGRCSSAVARPFTGCGSLASVLLPSMRRPRRRGLRGFRPRRLPRPNRPVVRQA
jgi:hypothetical protein